ncbi:Choline transport protein [Exophiala dermatitidis]
MTVYTSDAAALEAAGKKQVLKREWNFWALLGMSATTLCTWEATSALFAGAYTNGGPASVVYGFIVSVLGTLCIAASLAEMASISPIAGAQYHWSAEHSPLKWRALISYIQGWITITGWVAAVASVCYLIATMIQGLAILNYSGYEAKRWHATLMMIAFAGVAALGNTFGKKFLPLWETLGGVLHVLFFFIVMIAILATSTKANNDDVWGTLINDGGWGSDGVSFCLGFLTPAFALAGVDAVVHMSEEAYDAPKNVPRAMIWSVVINGTAAFAYILTILYAITDTDAVFETPTGYPIIAVFLQATNSQKGATAMMTAVVLVFTMNLFGCMASVSRLIWAFARDKGLPCSRVFSHITPWNKCPTNSVLAIFAAVSLLSLINIGSTTAFNALISLTTLGFYFSYAIPTVMFAIRRFSVDNPISFGPWTMGRFGLSVNIASLVFCLFLIIFLPFPPILPVTSQNMNYASPVFIGVMVIAAVNYFVRARKRFHGPIKEVASEASSENVAHESVVAEKQAPST